MALDEAAWWWSSAPAAAGAPCEWTSGVGLLFWLMKRDEWSAEWPGLAKGLAWPEGTVGSIWMLRRRGASKRLGLAKEELEPAPWACG